SAPDEGDEAVTDEGAAQPGDDLVLPSANPPPALPAPDIGAPSAQRTPIVPRLEGRGVRQADGSTRLMGTITLDIDPDTNLIAAPSCPVIRTKTFPIGQQPTDYCGPEHHRAGGSRPRVVGQ
ncbi:MAG TPA: hypothetical protein VM870_02070, partial [Pyrinomonadaceae bacterium]|nr:hypothetical protein [Pyrinomonadaceae bacterium]